MQLFLMVVKGMFGSVGKWALDEDSWKQLQIPAQKQTEQMLKPQNLGQTPAWFDLAEDDKYMRKLDKCIS